MPKRKAMSTTDQTERAGAAAVTYAELERIEQSEIGRAHIKDVFSTSNLDNRTWRTMSVREQLAGLRTIQRRLEQPDWQITTDGWPFRPLPPDYVSSGQAARDRFAVTGRED